MFTESNRVPPPPDDATTRFRALSDQPDQHVLAMLRWAKLFSLLIAAATSLITLGLWFIPDLQSLAPPICSKMVANTALGMLLATCALSLSAQRRSLRQFRLAQVAGLAVMLVGS